LLCFWGYIEIGIIKIEDILDKFSRFKTYGAKIETCKRAIEFLSQVETYPEPQEIIKNFDELKKKVQ
jgi:hypothetical protein